MPFEKVVTTLGSTFNRISSTIYLVFSGKHQLKKGEKAGISKRTADIGILGILDIMASVDLCRIISYGSEQLLSSGLVNGIDKKLAFDPTSKPTSDSTIAIVKWNIQKTAYDIQIQIDKYRYEFGEIANKGSLNNLVSDIVTQLMSIQKIKDRLTPEELQEGLEAMALLENFIANAVGYLDNLPSIDTMNNSDVAKVLAFIDKVRNICIKIQSLNSPAKIATSFLSKSLQNDIAKLDKVIDPKKVVTVLKSIIQSATAIQRSISTVLSIVKTLQVFINIVIVIIIVLKFILRFFKVLPAPTMFATVGVTTTASAADKNITDKVNDLIKDIQAISGLLSSIINLFTSITVNIGLVIEKLNIIILNLESCNNLPQGLLDEIKATRDSLVETKKEVDNFLDNYKTKKENKKNTFGEYTIIIEREQVTSTNIRLIRRYGIAVDANGILVVQSTPTFASSDNIIIQEVKLLLASKGLIKAIPSNLTSEELSIIEEALAYLEGDNNFDDNASIEEEIIDAGDNEDENQGIGLNAFINKLKGGKSLRKRVRVAMNNSKTKLQSQVGSQGSKNITTVINKVDSSVGQGANENTPAANVGKLLTPEQRQKYRKDLIKFGIFVNKKAFFPKQYKLYQEAENALKQDKLAGGPG